MWVYTNVVRTSVLLTRFVTEVICVTLKRTNLTLHQRFKDQSVIDKVTLHQRCKDQSVIDKVCHWSHLCYTQQY